MTTESKAEREDVQKANEEPKQPKQQDEAEVEGHSVTKHTIKKTEK